MLELHIWGPAFGLPSIDAECLATICYLQHALPSDAWVLIPCSNPSLNPFQQLPALHDGEDWTAGFENISQYIASVQNGAWNLDRESNDEQRADCDAYTSFLHSRGIPLLDLSMYVSSENYASCTRSALSELLNWPQSWTIPHVLKEEAKRRSDHLGLSALDVDAAHEQETSSAGLTAQIPKSLRRPKQTVNDLLGRSVQKTRFRLDAVMEEFFEPINTKLGQRDWLIAGRISSADCLAIAILSLMRISDLPQGWLRETLTKKYPTLNKWAKDQSDVTYGHPVSLSSIMHQGSIASGLPWRASSALSWTEASMLAIETFVSSIPVIRYGYERQSVPVQGDHRQSGLGQKRQIRVKMRDQQRIYSQAVMLCLGATSILGWLVRAGYLGRTHLSPVRPTRRSFGEAGAILGL